MTDNQKERIEFLKEFLHSTFKPLEQESLLEKISAFPKLFDVGSFEDNENIFDNGNSVLTEVYNKLDECNCPKCKSLKEKLKTVLEDDEDQDDLQENNDDKKSNLIKHDVDTMFDLKNVNQNEEVKKLFINSLDEVRPNIYDKLNNEFLETVEKFNFKEHLVFVLREFNLKFSKINFEVKIHNSHENKHLEFTETFNFNMNSKLNNLEELTIPFKFVLATKFNKTNYDITLNNVVISYFENMLFNICKYALMFYSKDQEIDKKVINAQSSKFANSYLKLNNLK